MPLTMNRWHSNRWRGRGLSVPGQRARTGAPAGLQAGFLMTVVTSPSRPMRFEWLGCRVTSSAGMLRSSRSECSGRRGKRWPGPGMSGRGRRGRGTVLVGSPRRSVPWPWGHAGRRGRGPRGLLGEEGFRSQGRDLSAHSLAALGLPAACLSPSGLSSGEGQAPQQLLLPLSSSSSVSRSKAGMVLAHAAPAGAMAVSRSGLPSGRARLQVADRHSSLSNERK